MMKIYLFPEKTKSSARVLVNSLVVQKRLLVPDYCEACLYDVAMLHTEEAHLNILKIKSKMTNKQILEAHHYNYNLPLSIWWLCPTCHKMLHVIQRKFSLACIDLLGARDLINNFRYDYEHSWIEQLDDDEYLFEDIYF